MLITISGDAGSGKSTLAKKLEAALSFPRLYVGGIRRQMAQEMGMTLEEFNTWSETNPDGDIPVDQRVVEEVKKLDNAIVEGRVMYHFLPESIKIFVTVDTRVAAERVFNELSQDDSRNEANDLTSIEAVEQSLITRKASDDARYKKYYQIDVFNPDNYDLVIDSSHLSIDEVFDKAMGFIQKTLLEKGERGEDSSKY